MSFTERLKLFRIDRKPEMSDLRNYRTHSCHPEFVKEMAFKYHLSSAYPQHNLVRLGMPQATAIVDIDGVRVHLIMGWNTEIDAFGLWTIPGSEENLTWFSKIFCHLLDTAQEVYQKKVSLKSIVRYFFDFPVISNNLAAPNSFQHHPPHSPPPLAASFLCFR